MQRTYAAVTLIGLAVTFSFPASAQQLPVASAPAALDVQRVVVERSDRDDDLALESAPPLIVNGSGNRRGLFFGPPPPRVHFGYALGDQTPPGVHSVVGYLGRNYPAAAELVAESFERSGDTIRLVFRCTTAKKAPAQPPAAGWVMYFEAPLPADLPDGKYKLAVAIHDLPPGATGRPEYELEFSKPDAKTKHYAERLAALERAPLEQWVDHYRAAAAEAKGYAEPHEGHVTGGTSMDNEMVEYSLVTIVRRKMVARGTELTPHLLEGLKQECVRNPEPEPGNPPAGLSRELMRMLVESGDARAAPLLVEIIGGKRDANSFVRAAAVEALERLTFVRFQSSLGSDHESLKGPDAVVSGFIREPDERKSYWAMLAPKYEKWLAENPTQGADRTPWLNAARRRGRALLEGDVLSAAYSGATFLRSRSNGVAHDDDPDRTTARIAAILDGPSRLKLPHANANWLRLLVHAGPVDERYAPIIVRLARESPGRPRPFVDELNEVGGREAMAYRIAVYQEDLAKVKELGADPEQRFAIEEDRRKREWVGHLQRARYGIERWAGRTFAGDADIMQWWSKAKDGTQRQWLEEGLPILAAQADAGSGRSQFFLRLILSSELPNEPDHSTWNPPNSFSDPPPRPESGPPFRVKWLTENRARLNYVPREGRFQLKPAPK